jgi:hypothetical protein
VKPQPSMTPREWLEAATGGTFNEHRLELYADAHVYIAQRILRLWDAPLDGVPPADVYCAQWPAEDDGQ